jgi:hypothetical protein
MTILQHIQRKIVEELSNLYEAFFAAQEDLEENEYVSARRVAQPRASRSATLGNCEPHVS